MRNGQITYRVVAIEMDGTRDVMEEGRTARDAARLQAILFRSERYRSVLVEEEQPKHRPSAP